MGKQACKGSAQAAGTGQQLAHTSAGAASPGDLLAEIADRLEKIASSGACQDGFALAQLSAGSEILRNLEARVEWREEADIRDRRGSCAR